MEKVFKFKDLQSFIDKTDQVKKENKFDLSSDQDLSVAIMNLVGIEEHLFFTGAKTEKPGYYDLIKEVRDIRKVLLGKLIKDYEGEVWCISKHLLAASYRLMEVGAKLLDQDGRREEAYEFFDKAYELYSLFWGVNLRVIDTKGIKEIGGMDPGKKGVGDEIGSDNDASDAGGAEMLKVTAEEGGSSVVMKKLKDIVRKIVNCCIE